MTCAQLKKKKKKDDFAFVSLRPTRKIQPHIKHLKMRDFKHQNVANFQSCQHCVTRLLWKVLACVCLLVLAKGKC